MSPNQLMNLPSASERPRLPRFSSLAVANAFLAMARAEGAPALSPRKLHDLVYVAQGVHLADSGASLLRDSLMAERDGVYAGDLREAGCWGAHAVTEAVSCVRMDEQRGQLREITPRIPPHLPVCKLLARVWRVWGPVPEFDLHDFTREHGAPWDLIWNDEDRPDDDAQALPNGTLRVWFREYIARRPAPTPRPRGSSQPAVRTQRMLARPDPERLRVV